MNNKTTFHKIIYAFFIGCILFLLNTEKSTANHLVGGELTYECLGGNEYRVNLLIYRDCYSNGAPFDDPAAIYLRNSNGDYLQYNGFYRIPLSLTPSDSLRIPVNDEDICSDNIPDVCVSRANYSRVLTLSPLAGGYEVVYQRCCRNTTIQNIIFPGETGSTYSITIPHETSNCSNSSPVFNNFPPIVICNNYPIFFDHSATDSDGDSLSYELCLPFDGATANAPGNPIYDVGGNYIAPLFDFSITGDDVDNIPNPIGFINWQAGYSTNDPLGNPTDPLTINPVTGLLSGTPIIPGQYVVGICVKEYRSGVLLSTNKRDFQFNVTTCDIIKAIPGGDVIEIGIGIGGEVIFEVINCDDAIVNFNNESIGATEYEWDFGDGSPISTEANPMHIYADSGTYNLTLIASNGSTCIDTATVIIKNYPIFQTDFVAETNKCQELPFQFNDQTFSTYGTIDSWYWDFGDGSAVGPGSGTITTDVNTSGNFMMPSHYYQDYGPHTVTLVSTNDKGCRDTMQYDIDVWKQPEPTINFDFLCIDVPVNFTGEGASEDNIASWQWDFEGNPAIGPNVSQSYNTPGDYNAQLLVESTQGCKDSVELDFTIYPETFADAGLDTSMCLLTSVQLDASNSTGGAGVSGNTYTWEPAEYVENDSVFNPNVIPPIDQVFTVFVADPNGCTDSASVFVDVLPLPAIEAGNDIILCIKDSVQLNGFIPADVTNFYWEPSIDLTDANIANPIAFPQDTIAYSLYAIDVNNCEKRDTVQVNVIPEVNAMATSPLDSICEGDMVQFSASGGMIYRWVPSSDLDDGSIPNPVANPTEDTEFLVEISNPPCFVDTIFINLKVNPLPFVEAGDDVTLNVGETTQFSGMGEETYQWTPPIYLDSATIYNPIAQPLFTTVYTLTTQSDKGCIASDSLTVNVTNIFDVIMPNAFSPNGDGIHDDIGLKTLGLESLIDFSIFNRWGQKIYQTSNLTDRWDGTFKGIPQEIGVYMYYVRANKYIGGIFEHQGHITLIR